MEKVFVGLQLYGIRDVLQGNPEKFEEVMQQVKDMGYDGVEFAGLYGLEPEYIRDTLKKIGLIPISAHVPLAEMMEDINYVGETYAKIGCEYVAVPYLPEEYRPNAPGYETAIEMIADYGKAVKPYGLQMLYHNHDFEFVTLPNGTYGFDDIYTQIPADVLQVQPDTCWIKVAGEDPAAYVRKYTGRCPIVHLKDFIKEGDPANMYELIGTKTEEKKISRGMFKFRAVGSGQQDWQPILDATVEAGAKWVIVEQDQSYELASLECARMSREYLKTLGW